VIAQECLLRVRSEQRASPYVALSPLSHIDLDEANGIEYHNLRPSGFDGMSALRTCSAHQRLAAVIVGCRLPRRISPAAVAELERISACAVSTGAAAFRWRPAVEAAAGYGRTLRAVAALADSVYVSSTRASARSPAAWWGHAMASMPWRSGAHAKAPLSTPPIRMRCRLWKGWNAICRAWRTTSAGRVCLRPPA
jgi:hypothetical protein